MPTRVEVNCQDSAFDQPTKSISPVCTAEEGCLVRAEHQWAIVAAVTGSQRRVVPLPLSVATLNSGPIRRLVKAGVCVICAGGGGMPVVWGADGKMQGVGAVIDKDRTAALLSQVLRADILLMLTDMEAIFRNWGPPDQTAIDRIAPDALDAVNCAAGSMRPKITAASDFVRTAGQMAGIGRLLDARAIIEGRAGTQIRVDTSPGKLGALMK